MDQMVVEDVTERSMAQIVHEPCQMAPLMRRVGVVCEFIRCEYLLSARTRRPYRLFLAWAACIMVKRNINTENQVPQKSMEMGEALTSSASYPPSVEPDVQLLYRKDCTSKMARKRGKRQNRT